MSAGDAITVTHGECLNVMRSMPADSVHSIVTDPPYNLNFMGKGWDRSGIANSVELWRECLRVLKPGGHLISFGGTRTYHRMASAVEDAGFDMRDSITWLYGSGFPKSRNVSYDMSDEDYGPWDGWGTALKPASEPIAVARKPFKGTVADNVVRHGTGALNIDGCRTAPTTGLTRPARQGKGTIGGWANYSQSSGDYGTQDGNGRWPANLVLSHCDECGEEKCADGCPVAELDRQSGVTVSTNSPRYNTAEAHNQTASMGKSSGDWTTGGFTDSGGASRFFPVFRYQAKAPTRERPKVNGVSHPTVKPLALIQWLCRLVTPLDGIVLDPFAGSGTTVEACIKEGFRCIAIENDETYIPLIQRRIARAAAAQ